MLILLFFIGINNSFAQTEFSNLKRGKNCLNFSGNTTNATYRKLLVFSDKGAWFGYGFLDKPVIKGGFSGPFLMTEQDGVWLSSSLVALNLMDAQKNNAIDWTANLAYQHSYNSHLEQVFKNKKQDCRVYPIFKQYRFIKNHKKSISGNSKENHDKALPVNGTFGFTNFYFSYKKLMLF